ncbi:LytTR family DNA-binding domain-containing protein [Dyadobacter sp. CY312]|uniref:LytR/AlgR family response regulator transcription factor n=1 Tax=Dyadobacter sp. CY312 TaxID=2907303 RepID=UPI001F2BCC0C|nr:LytTR family DNA-binding domain-containing protein [Dyadobacter sp. CY312]MCE7044498.1 LytTR family DNA-binding domain-containing protein [Dyadobacter sp. CY312]
MKKGKVTVRCIFVDDEPMGLNVLLSHASKIPNLNVLGAFASGTEALTFLQNNEVDLAFLDIQMPDLSGLELARILSPAITIVFTTAHPEYAVAGFDLAVTDYLLKPVGFSRFLQAIDRTIANVASASGGDNLNDFIFVKTGYDWTRITLSNLLYIEADGNYLTFHETDKRILTRMKLSEILEKLPNAAFVRIHKSFVIAISQIDKIERHQITLSGQVLPLSATYRDDLLARLD